MRKSALTIGILVLITGLLAIPRSIVSNFQTASAHSSPGRQTTGTLTLEQRIAYQFAIEGVYWRHKLWPAENQSPKPRLEDVMPLSKLRARVEDALLKSDALERDYKQSGRERR